MTPWRTLLYRELKNISLDGDVLDLGGLNGSDYHRLIGGRHIITTVNLDTNKQNCDLSFDLENNFPLKDEGYHAVLSINVMEHIYNYRQFLKEIHRVLAHGGTAVVAVPFMVQVHPSPRDYFRYTGDALARLGAEVGFEAVSIRAIGKGPFTAASQTVFNVLRFDLLRSLSFHIASALDRFVNIIDRKGNFATKKYPLGFVVILEKHK